MAATKLSTYQAALRHLADARLALITDDVTARYAMDDAWDASVAFVLRQAPWRFALKTAALVSGGTLILGFTYSWSLPADWLRTHAIFISETDGRESPLDLREHEILVATNITSARLTIRYVSSDYLDPALASHPWPQHFADLVAAYLAFSVAARVTGDRNAPARMSELFSSLLPEAVAVDAAPENPWLKYQRDGRFHRGARYVQSQGGWRFLIKTVAITVESGTPAAGYAHSYAQPADWLTNHAIYISAAGFEYPFDLREQAGFWSTNAGAFTARYITTAIDSTAWPDLYRRAVLSFLDYQSSDEYGHGAQAGYRQDPQAAPSKAAIWHADLAAALAAFALPPSPWLEFQLDGRLTRATQSLGQLGFWQFALVETAISAHTGTPAKAFTYAFAIPTDDWLRTHALFVVSNGRECPIDVREEQHTWSANVTAINARYVSWALIRDATKWSDVFMAAVLARLQYDRDGEGPSGKAAETAYQSALAAALATNTVSENPWLQHQLDGSFQRAAQAMVNEADWRFARIVALINTPTGSSGGAGFAHSYAIPSGWSRTRALFRIAADGRRVPFDVREHITFWHTNAANFYADYVSADLAMDSTKWPAHYMRAVLRQLEFDHATRTDEPDQQIDAAIWKDALAAAIASDADAPDPWLSHQLSGEFDRASRAVIGRGNWTFAGALKEVAIDVSAQKTEAADAGFPYRYPLPLDWLKTHALYVPFDGRECPINIREDAQEWSTDASLFTARYVSTDALDALTWPQPVLDAVRAWLDWQAEGAAEKPGEEQLDEQEFARLLADAQAIHGIPDDPWLRHQLSGQFAIATRMVLDRGRWRFAVKTLALASTDNPTEGTVSPGYTYRLGKPGDLLRTLRLYYSIADGLLPRWYDVDYRDEDDAFHTNYTPVVVRYVSRLGLDATRWPANFRDAVLTWLEHVEARADPKLTGVAAAKLQLFERQCKEAENLDDESDMPRIQGPGRLVSGRYGRGAGSFSRQQGWPPYGGVF